MHEPEFVAMQTLPLLYAVFPAAWQYQLLLEENLRRANVNHLKIEFFYLKVVLYGFILPSLVTWIASMQHQRGFDVCRFFLFFFGITPSTWS